MDAGTIGTVVGIAMLLIAAIGVGATRRGSSFTELDALTGRLEGENTRLRADRDDLEQQLREIVAQRDQAIAERDAAREEIEHERDRLLDRLSRARLRELYWRQRAEDLIAREHAIRRLLEATSVKPEVRAGEIKRLLAGDDDDQQA